MYPECKIEFMSSQPPTLLLFPFITGHLMFISTYLLEFAIAVSATQTPDWLFTSDIQENVIHLTAIIYFIGFQWILK